MPCCPQVPQYSELMGYTEEPLPPYTPYAPQMLDMPLMEGAFEEEAGLHPTGLVPDVSEWLTMPEKCLLRSQPTLPIGTFTCSCFPFLHQQSVMRESSDRRMCVCPIITSIMLLKRCS